MTIRRILNLLRALFLLGALACLGTKCAWDVYYPQIRKLDWGLVKLYTRDAEAALEQAKEELRAGQSEAAIATLTELSSSLEHLTLGDRLAPVRSKALDLLADECRKSGDLDEALRWSEQLFVFDDRDFINLLRRAELFEELGMGEEALPQLREIFRIGSTSGAAQLAYLRALARRGLVKEAAVALLELRGRGPLALPLEDWQIRWSDTLKLGGERRGDLTLAFDPDAGVHRATFPFAGSGVAIETIRIDLPVGSLPSLTGVRVTLRTSEGEEHVLTLENEYATKHLVRDGDTLRAYGEIDPFFTLRHTGEPAAIQDVVECRLELLLTARLPDDIMELFADGLPAEELEGWMARFGREAVETLAVAVEQ